MIKLANILFENHPLSVEVQKLENDLKVKYPSIDKLGIYMDKPKNSLYLSDLYVKIIKLVTIISGNHIYNK
jgi:hypothetical protein